jgi:N-acetylmuramoyl-L-alanine amidase
MSDDTVAGIRLFGRPTLRFGDAGPAVSELQRRLATLGYYVIVNAEFRHRTLAAVRNFQSDYNLPVDGVVGPNTWAVLDRLTNAPYGDT